MLVTYKDDKSSRQRPTRDVVLIAENIRSAFNLGSIFRTAECMGVGKVYLTGYTATPEDGKVRKTTMGTHEWIMWEWVRDPCQLIHDLKVEGYLVVGLETADKALTLADVKEQPKIALVLGNERFGVDKETLSLCDQVVKIRTFGRKNSLNVGVACGMALQSLLGEGPSN